MFIINYILYCFLGDDDELNFSDTGTGGIILGFNLFKKNGNTVVCGGKKAAWIAFYFE